MRSFFPYRTMQIATASPPEKVIAALRRHVWETGLLSLGSSLLTFRGRVTADGFKICRQIGYRNSFFPVLVGTLRRNGSGSEIAIVMRLNFMVAAFVILWFGCLVSALVGLLTARHPLGGLLVVGGMLAFGVVLVGFSFSSEANKTEVILADILGSS